MNTTPKEHEYDLWVNWKQTKSTDKLSSLIRSLDPLIQSQVNKYTLSSIPRPALEAEARRLTLGAFETYQPEKSQLNTHVVNHLKHLQRYVLNYQNVGKIPEHRGIVINRFQSTKENLADDLGREPSHLELADALNWAPSEVKRMESELRKDLNISFGEEEEETFFDKDYLKTDKTKDLIEFAYYSASNPEKVILEYTFGLGGKPKKDSAAEIALLSGIPEFKVRQYRQEISKKINNIINIYGT